MDPLHVALVAFPLVGLAIGFLLGRRSSEAAERARILEAELDAQRAALEQVQGGEAHRPRGPDARRVPKPRAIASAWSSTSTAPRTSSGSLTLRYRELFEHLAEGARELCPEASSALQAGLTAPVLGGGAADPEPPAAPEGDASKVEGQTPS